MPAIPNAVSNLARFSAYLRRLTAVSAGVAAILLLAPAQRAEALSPASLGAAPLSAKYVSDGLIEVRGGHGGGHGGGFHGGGGFRGFHGGFHRGGFAGRHVFVGHRAHFRGRHFFRSRFHDGYYPYTYGARCRVIWTYYGPRRICRTHRWHHRRWHRRVWW
jgi:hypothetical protein